MSRNDSPTPVKKEPKYEMTVLYEVRLVLEQIENTNDPHVLGYPETEELDEKSVYVSDREIKSKKEFELVKKWLDYLHVEKGQMTEEQFKKIGDQFIDTCKAMGLDKNDVRFVLSSLLKSFQETVDAGKWEV